MTGDYVCSFYFILLCFILFYFFTLSYLDSHSFAIHINESRWTETIEERPEPTERNDCLFKIVRASAALMDTVTCYSTLIEFG